MLSYTLEDLIKTAFGLRASDVFIKAGSPPMMRLDGKVVPFEQEYAPLTPSQARDLCFSHMTHEQIAKFEHRLAIDLAFTVEGVCRVRANVYMQRQTVAGVFRLIPLQHWRLEELWADEPEIARVLAGLTQYRQGLVLVTGPTGCGKSTTLAAMIDLINETRRGHIVTIEDPIEFVHTDKQCIVSQREVGIDTESFIDAMRFVVRESPDVILIGEMRDVETMHACMQAAETGHLVFSTVHTPSAYETMDRIVNMFPPEEKKHILQRLANTLRGIVAQKLVPRAGGRGRIAAVEIMINTPTVQKMIEDGHIGEIYNAIREGEHWGMRTMNQCLYRYVQKQLITPEEALNYAGIHSELRQMLRRL
ncbi:MAG: PilT/PilU family type 4a pilus ATPase [Fimbriimonadales bacterium]|nr:PilT/PilU family type 4a pilus ATPase [Fimbriimonadales bacterium]MDW8051021.1 PilT/PilU family type 4a pilus ATPase [Armatimonadota bacterium]